MGILTEKIIKKLKLRDVRSLKEVEQVLETIEDEIIEESSTELLNTLIDYIEKERPDTLDLYIKLKKIRDKEEE